MIRLLIPNKLRRFGSFSSFYHVNYYIETKECLKLHVMCFSVRLARKDATTLVNVVLDSSAQRQTKVNCFDLDYPVTHCAASS